jgi:oligopeptide/dipeptide ABC transporter ATP-binding protein
MLDKVGIHREKMRCFPHEFSGGQRQRIGIARALILKPKLIICDEPVSALDVSIQAQVINLLGDLKKEFHLSYILIAHDLSVVNHVSNRIAVMYLGKVVELASNKNLLAKPLHPYTQALMSAVPVLDPDKKKKRIILKGDVPSPIKPPSGCRFHPRCPQVMGICPKVEPIWAEVEPHHFAMCHLYGACQPQ